MMSTASATFISGPTHCGLRVITCVTAVASASRLLASTRVIRSRSVRMPCIVPALSMMSTLPQLARVIAHAASWTLADGPRLSTWRWVMD